LVSKIHVFTEIGYFGPKYTFSLRTVRSHRLSKKPSRQNTRSQRKRVFWTKLHVLTEIVYFDPKYTFSVRTAPRTFHTVRHASVQIVYFGPKYTISVRTCSLVQNTRFRRERVFGREDFLDGRWLRTVLSENVYFGPKYPISLRTCILDQNTRSH